RAGPGRDAAPARTLPVHGQPACRTENAAADAEPAGQRDCRTAAIAQGLHAPGRENLRRALLGRRLPGRRRVHPAQARRPVPALCPALQGGRVTVLRYPGRLLRLLLVIALGALLAGAVALLSRLGIGPRPARRQRLTRWCHGRLAGALPFRIRVHGELPDTPMLWVGNHVSWTDIPLLGQLAPLAFLAKAEVRQWPLAGWLALHGGTLFIRRGAGDSGRVAEQLAERLRQPGSVMLFPEGTSTDGTAVRIFHGRLLSGAIDAGVAIQPVAIRYQRQGEPDS